MCPLRIPNRNTETRTQKVQLHWLVWRTFYCRKEIDWNLIFGLKQNLSDAESNNGRVINLKWAEAVIFQPEIKIMLKWWIPSTKYHGWLSQIPPIVNSIKNYNLSDGCSYPFSSSKQCQSSIPKLREESQTLEARSHMSYPGQGKIIVGAHCIAIHSCQYNQITFKGWPQSKILYLLS